MNSKSNRMRIAIFGLLCVLICTGMLLLINFRYRNKPKWDPVDMGYMGYQKLIFVGDSRTVNMRKVNTFQDVKFVAKYGGNLKWMREEGRAKLENLLAADTNPMPTAVIFNLGVNDYRNHLQNYISYFKEIAPTLEEHNCYLFYMSVNPVEEDKLEDNPKYAGRTNEEIEAFNEKLREGLEGAGYVWLDMYQELKRHGFSTRDGLHYTKINRAYILSRGIKMVLDAKAYPQDYCWCKKEGNWYAFRWKSNTCVRGAWIRDGKGKFYLDPKGRLVRDCKIDDENGELCEVGSTGRAKEN